jgi:hypothetical protein
MLHCATGAGTVFSGPEFRGSDGSDFAVRWVGRSEWCRLEDISPMIEGQAQPAMALRWMTILLNCFCDRLYG